MTQGAWREPDRTEIMDSTSLKFLMVLMIVCPLACAGSTPTVASNSGGNGAGGAQSEAILVKQSIKRRNGCLMPAFSCGLPDLQSTST